MKAKEGKNKTIIEIIIILFVIIISFFSGFVVSRYVFLKCEENSCTIQSINTGKELKEENCLKIGIYSGDKMMLKEIADAGEEYYRDISVDFRENNKVYIIETEGEYAKGTYTTDGKYIICLITKVSKINENDTRENIDVTEEIKFEILENNRIKILENSIHDNSYLSSHAVGNEYVYDMLENNK